MSTSNIKFLGSSAVISIQELIRCLGKFSQNTLVRVNFVITTLEILGSFLRSSYCLILGFISRPFGVSREEASDFSGLVLSKTEVNYSSSFDSFVCFYSSEQAASPSRHGKGP